jgi:THO complex subunit 2
MLSLPNYEESQYEIISSNINKIIGFKNLDPNRVLDIILDCFEDNLDNFKFYVYLLNNVNQRIGQFNKKSICHWLGFKLKHI